MDPVTLGLCSQIDLDFEVNRAAKERPKVEEDRSQTLVSAEITTARPTAAPASQLEVFGVPTPKPKPAEERVDVNSVFGKLKERRRRLTPNRRRSLPRGPPLRKLGDEIAAQRILRQFPADTGILVRIFDGAAEAKLIALACGSAPAGHARWTLRLLEEKVVELQIVGSASDNTIGRTLKKTFSSPIASSNG